MAAASAPAAASACWCRGAARSAACSISPTRNAALAYQTHFGEGATVAFDALDELRRVTGPAGPAAPDRMLRHLDAPGTRHRRRRWSSASTGGCERASTGSSGFEAQGPGPRARAGHQAIRTDGPKCRDESPTWAMARAPAVVLDDFAAIHEVVLRRYRRVLEQGGPFPDLILVDGGKGQLSAAYAALRDVGLDRLIAVGIAKQEELLFTRDRIEGLALPRESAALRLRAADSRRGAPVCGDVPSRVEDPTRPALRARRVAGIGPRRRKQLLTTFGSVTGVRRASREELEAAVGAKTAATAVIRHFAGRPVRPRWMTARATVIAACQAARGHHSRRSHPDLSSLPFHEAAHAWTADRLGDPTARDARAADAQSARAHRLDRDGVVPADRDVDPALPIIGWAKPVPVNMRNLRASAARFRHRRGGRADQQLDSGRRRCGGPHGRSQAARPRWRAARRSRRSSFSRWS